MEEVILQRPEIEQSNPFQDIRFTDVGGKLISEECTLKIKVVFTEGDKLDCSVRVGIKASLRKYFKIEPNTVDSNGYEILRYYGIVKSGKTDVFKFRITSTKSMTQIRAYASPVSLTVRVTNCSNELSMEESVRWRII